MSGYGYDVGPSGYDADDRLINWERDDGQLDQAWNLSAVGDWDSYTENSAVQTRTHNAVHELTGIDSQALTYDVKGNLTADHLGRTFAWDADNMLASVTVSPTATVGEEGTHSYAYDAIGRRVSKSVDNNDSTFTTNVYAQLTLPIPPLDLPGGQVLAEYDAGAAAGSPTQSYAYGSYCDEPLVLVAGATRHYYHRDGRYDAVALTDSTGGMAERYGYDAYGGWKVTDGAGSILAGSAVGNTYEFTGRRWDGKSGLWYFRARDYGGRLGRFLSRDVKGFDEDSWELQGYAGSQPYGFLDPAGFTSLLIGPICRMYEITCEAACNKWGKPPEQDLDEGGFGLFSPEGKPDIATTLCVGGTKCICYLKTFSEGVNPGDCPSVDRIIKDHEYRHFPEVGCPTGPGVPPIDRAPFPSPRAADEAECKQRKTSLGEIDEALESEKNPTCIRALNDMKRNLAEWVALKCP